MRIKPLGKVVILILAIGVAFGIYRMYSGGGLGFFGNIIPGAKIKESVVPKAGDLPERGTGVTAINSGNVRMPGREAAAIDAPEVRFLVWAWNAQMGMMFANGGPVTTNGSLMGARKVNLHLTRQDDAGKMQEALVAFANDLSQGNPNPSKGAHFVAIMGDGAATFLQGVNSTLDKLGSEYRAKVVGSCGYSYGEDKFMGPQSWKSSPSNCRGGVVSGYLRDGDWNIAQKWLADNGLKNNPDEKTWDPDALNWVAANDYIDAAEKYVAGYSETRAVVRNGKKTGETKKITVQGVVTWTPGDVTIAEKRGGLVSIVSTREYSGQMPNVIIGIDKWMRTNRQTVEDMLAAIMEGGDAVKSGKEEVMQRAGEISQQVYHEEGANADYWVKYYKGARERDKQGITVDLGGSYANSLADNMLTFGLVEGSQNAFAATYQVFGDIVVQQYPELVPRYAPVSQILDTTYLQALMKKSSTVAAVRPPTEEQKASLSQPIRSVVSRKAWNITFHTGQATFTPEAKSTLEKLLRDLIVAAGTNVELHGHTDSVGSPAANMALSEARAFTVKKWLEGRAPVNFPKGRIRVFSHGQANPIAPNSSDAGRAQNRRVEIVMGTS